VRGIRDDAWHQNAGRATLLVSSSHGVADLKNLVRRSMPLTSALDMSSTDRVLRLPILEGEHEAVRLSGLLARISSRIRLEHIDWTSGAI
jgi:hypothetical protein